MSSITDLRWHRIADLDELPEGRVKTVAAGTRSLALTPGCGVKSAAILESVTRLAPEHAVLAVDIGTNACDHEAEAAVLAYVGI